MTEQELQHQRAELWHVDGHAIRTLEDADGFIESVGLCLMYPARALLIPSFFAAYAGTQSNLPDVKHAFADPRNQPAIELMVRLLRERRAYEINFLPESPLLVSAEFFPYIYPLFSDHNPKAAPRVNAQGGQLSPLAIKVFEAIQKRGPASKKQLQDLIGREMSGPALDRVLNELWSILRITRVDYREHEGTYWDLLSRWSPEVVKEGSFLSAPEAVSLLMGKYLEATVAATREEIEQFFSHLTSVSKAREALNALLAAREFSFVAVGSKTLIHLTPVAPAHQRQVHG